MERFLDRTINTKECLHSFVVVKIKSFSKPGRLPEGIANSKDFVVVLVALETWNQNTGFFLNEMELEKGEDIIVNGGDEIVFSGHGGGLITMIFFKVED